MRRAPACNLSRWALYGVLFGVLLALGVVEAARADGYTPADTLAAIDAAADSGAGVSWAHLYRVVTCEDRTLDPYAVGDHGTSYGAAQLHQGGNELPRFYAAGWTDPYDPYQAVQFLADELAVGRARAWSCR